ncbi:S41 family peptidase [Billgrantia montanilacus]|uniref:Peptidase S41 n=1 Tax=Billgrantia montanilacus TaxID=2282305 RepID=A0A368TSA6_9GAMM|nr:S41 family peptidase [Halomonas montanilacus]RCV87226.1 peptidase S41 [Halomonas montanilacus]
MARDIGSMLGNAAQRMALVAVTGGLLASAPTTATAEVGLPRFPSISPDGSALIFSWRGDLWRVPTDGGNAIRLTRHDLDDLYSSWSPDGEWIVFASMRDGYLNLWRMRRDGGELTQITHGDQHLRNPTYGVNEDGEPVITFSGMLEADVYRDQRPYQLSPEGGEYRRLHDAFGSEPQLSPDGQRVVFTRGGAYHGWNRRHYRGPDAMNVWLHDRETGEFEALTERDGDDGSARWANDETLLFMSDREDETVNLYRLELEDETRTLERLTDFDERDLQHFDVSRNGSTAILQVWDTLLTLDLEDPDAMPEPVSLRAAADGRDNHELRRINRDVSEAALSPDGQTMAYIAYGRVYVRHMDDQSPTQAVTPGTHARHKDIAWSPDGLVLYFVNDSDGTESIHEARVALTRDEIRQTHEGLSSDERPTRSWEFTAPPPEPPALAAPEEPSEPDPDVNGEPDLALQGEDPEDPFAPQDPGFLITPILLPTPSTPVDEPEPLQDQPIESESIPEVELDDEVVEDVLPERDPSRWHDAVQFDVQPLVASEHNDRQVSPSPDGRSLAFRRGRGDLMIRDLESGDERTLVEGWDSFTHWRWSPDSRYIAFSRNDLNFSANIFIVPADGSTAPVNITRHPRNDLNPRWSADGRKLSFISNRSGDSYDLYSVYLDRVIETYTPRERTTYYRNARNEADDRSPLPVIREESQEQDVTDEPVLELESAWRRVERITASPTHQSANEMTPGGDRYVFNAGSEGLFVMDWDGGNRTRLGPMANVQHLSTTGDRVVYISDGRVGVARLSGGTHQRPDISDRIRINRQAQSLQKFNEAARMIGESFYREDMKGLDWPQVVEEYETLIRRARTPSEFSDIANRLMGELAASHMGVSNPGPVSALREPSGRFGIEQERIVSQVDGRAGYRVTDVIPEGPASRGPMPLREGDIITEIDLQPFEASDTLLLSLRGLVDQEVIVTFDRPGDTGYTEYRTMLTPTSMGDLARLKYDHFREATRRQVEALSDGRIGYLHIQAMNQTSLEGFQGDLYAAATGKEGLIIDVRNNGGGHTTDRILTSIMAGEHAYTVPVGADPETTGHYPQDRLDAPRYTLPINMLVNEKSYSNAEILAHAFSTLGRGNLVGQQTYGGVISTNSYSLIDGATVRRPFRGWFLPDGTDMEHNGAMPDIPVEQTPEDEVADRDRQLERAVSDLLAQLDARE